MLWSVTKIVVFVAFIALLALGAAFVIDTGGEVRIAFGGQEISLEPIAAIIGFVLAMVTVWLAFALLGLLLAVFRFFNGDETAISSWSGEERARLFRKRAP